MSNDKNKYKHLEGDSVWKPISNEHCYRKTISPRNWNKVLANFKVIYISPESFYLNKIKHHRTFSVSKQILPARSTFGWKHGVVNVIVGASYGYVAGNFKLNL